MRSEGRLIRWNDERGFGFIAPTAGGSEVFVHISEFPMGGTRPTVGERLSFDVETTRDGKQRAINLKCLDRPVAGIPTGRASGHRPPGRVGGFRTLGIAIAFAGALAYYGHGVYSRHVADDAAPMPPAIPAPGDASPPGAIVVPAPALQPPTARTQTPARAAYFCDGRTRCAQMTSCEEATYFLRHCPGTEMDGDGDGVPCESQWCGR